MLKVGRSSLDSLREFSTIVADTGDLHAIARFSPRDATTNPSLILAAVRSDAYRHLLSETVARYRDEPIATVAAAILVRFGCEILALIPGRVSTEIDARLSFDARASVACARQIIAMYEAAGISRTRVLIKLAATWEGIQAAALLEREGIACNLTLVFALCQAVACADARVQLISPFVGRIYDWHKARAGAGWIEPANGGAADPGVRSVSAIHRYFKKFEIRTEVMGASFRSVGQVRALAGCDLLTISPALLEQLQSSDDPVPHALAASDPAGQDIDRLVFDEVRFRFALNADAMATEKLAEGIRGFVADAAQLDELILVERRS